MCCMLSLSDNIQHTRSNSTVLPQARITASQAQVWCARRSNWRKRRELNPQGVLLDALAPRCRHPSAGPSIKSHAGFAPATLRFADVCLAARLVRQSGGMYRCCPGVTAFTVRYPAVERTSPQWLQRMESNHRTPVSETGVCNDTNYAAMMHPAGLEPAHAPGLSRLPLPIGLRMHRLGSSQFVLTPTATVCYGQVGGLRSRRLRLGTPALF